MTEKEAYNHGYNGTLKLEELLAQFPAQPSLTRQSAIWSLMTS